jgi:hypothetical protein
VDNKEGLSARGGVEAVLCNMNKIRGVGRQQQPLPIEIGLEPLPSAYQKRTRSKNKICTTPWTMISTDTYILGSSQPSHHCQQGEGMDIKFHGKFSFVFSL